jgi:hypothetical protein
MDKYRAQVEIEYLFWGKEEKTAEEIRLRLSEVLSEMQSYNFSRGELQGVNKAIKVLEKLGENN